MDTCEYCGRELPDGWCCYCFDDEPTLNYTTPEPSETITEEE